MARGLFLLSGLSALVAVFALTAVGQTTPGAPSRGGGAPTSPVAAPSGVSNDPRCAAVRARTLAVIARNWRAGCGLLSDADLRARYTICARTPHGAWTVELTGLESERTDGTCTRLHGSWSLLHVSTNGTVTRPLGGSPMPELDDQNGYGTYWLQELRTSDIDGDGEPEVLVVHGGHMTEAAEVWHPPLFTFRSGRVEPYGPARAFAIIDGRDVDGDGRLDLVYEGRYRYEWRDCVGNSVNASAVDLLAHARPDGTFSLDDDVAARFVSYKCPSLAAALQMLRGSGDAGVEDRAAAVACARIWGASEAEVVGQLRASCRTFVNPDPCASPDANAGNCPPWTLAWAHLDPPLQLH